MAAHPIDVYVGKRIRAVRILVGMTQVQLSEQIGVRFQQLQKYEMGLNRVSSSKLWQIAKAVGVPVAAFFPSDKDEIVKSPLDDLHKTQLELIRHISQLGENERRVVVDLVVSLAKRRQGQA